MNELLPINDKNASALTMSSREITKLVNSRHSDVCKSIETLISKGVIGGISRNRTPTHRMVKSTMSTF